MVETQTELQSLFLSGVAGDAGSYNRFLQFAAQILRRVVARKLGLTDAEDVVQEILISIHKARHTYDGKRPILPWLMAIAKFRITDHLRKIYATSKQKTVDIDTLADVLADVTISPPDNESINELLGHASAKERQILTFMHVEGYTAKETGQKLGMKESAVKVAAHRAIKKIRSKLGT